MNEVTRIINAIEQGDPQATEKLLPLVYEELRVLAAKKMAQEKPGQTLQATALVHEVYIRLVGQEAQDWRSRTHFFAAAAEAMRRILVDNARRKQSIKRGGRRMGTQDGGYSNLCSFGSRSRPRAASTTRLIWNDPCQAIVFGYFHLFFCIVLMTLQGAGCFDDESV